MESMSMFGRTSLTFSTGIYNQNPGIVNVTFINIYFGEELGDKMKKLSLLIIMMATWMVASCGTTDGTKVGPELGYYENRKESKGGLIYSATSVWHCIVADKPWLDKDCD